MTFFRSNMLLVVGLVTGAVAGFLYWYFVGCNSGSCVITSKPMNSTVYGAVIGGLLFSMFKSEVNQKG